jgi:hypothetical protein
MKFIFLFFPILITITGCINPLENRDTSAYHPHNTYLSSIYEDKNNDLYLIRRYKSSYPYTDAVLMKFNRQTLSWDNISQNIKLDDSIDIGTTMLYKKEDKFYLHSRYTYNNGDDVNLIDKFMFTIIDKYNNITSKISSIQEYSINHQLSISIDNLGRVEEHNLTTNNYKYLYDLPSISTINDRLDIFIEQTDYKISCSPKQSSIEIWDKKTYNCDLVTQKNTKDMNYDYNYSYTIKLVRNINDNKWDITLINNNGKSQDIYENYNKVYWDFYMTSPKNLKNKYPQYKDFFSAYKYKIYIDANENLYLFKDENLVGDRDIIFEYYTKDLPSTPSSTQKIYWKK